MKYPFRLHIPFGRDLDLLIKCINSSAEQVEEFSSYRGKKIVILNNSGESIKLPLPYMDMIDIWELPFELMHAQQMNWMIKDTINKQLPFLLTLHTDAELLSGAMEEMLIRYEKIKDTQWFELCIGSAVFVMLNPQFFVQENVWYDPFLFPFYYMDIHIHRIARLRRWLSEGMPIMHLPCSFVKHVISHILKTDSIFKAKNDLVCVQAGKIYEEIWGGPPGKETNNDPYAKGTLIKNGKI